MVGSFNQGVEMKKGSLAALAAALLGLAGMHAAGAQEADDVARTAVDAARLIDASVAGQRVVMLGEIHGTAENPAIAGELAARWATGDRAQPMLLGLEATSADQARVDRYLASAGTTADRADLLAGKHWTEPMHDGRDSLAMAALIERMRALRAGGADVSVALFDAPGGGDRDARMASSLRSAIVAHPGARVLVLAGNVHAMTGPPNPMTNDGKPYTPPTTMARHLADLHPVSINFGALRGDAWTCWAGNDCGPHALPPANRSIDGPTIDRQDPGQAWDYFVTLPRFTASAPAVPASAPVAVTPAPDQRALLEAGSAALRANKRLVYDFWREVLEGGHVERAPAYLSADYIQHNPNVPTGREGFVAFFRKFAKPGPVADTVKAPLVSITAEGDRVVVASVNTLPRPGNAKGHYTTTWIDIFRIADGKIVEHWDNALLDR
jgi:predicted SnoaL-like aldol condensation-catalyzing enzyme